MLNAYYRAKIHFFSKKKEKNELIFIHLVIAKKELRHPKGSAVRVIKQSVCLFHHFVVNDEARSILASLGLESVFRLGQQADFGLAYSLDEAQVAVS